MTELILTLDCGTTGVKCGAFNRCGEAVFSHTEGYATYYPHPGWAEQHPDEQLAAAVKCVRLAAEKVGSGSVCCLVFTGTMNGCVAIDRSGEAVRGNIIHSDGRTGEQVQQLEQRIPMADYYRRTGNRTDVHSGLPKYMWLKDNEPESYRRAWKFVNIKDYLYGHFTGVHGCTDFSDGSLCNCIDIARHTWAWDVLQAAGIDREKMPELRRSTDVTGRLTAEYARLTGLTEGIPVAIGGGDGACAAHGARAHAPGAAYMNIGSSAWVSAMSTLPVLDAGQRLFNYYDMDPDCYNVCGTVQCGAAASNWAVENLIYPGSNVESCDFRQLEEMAQEVPAGSEGVFFLPTLMGERTPWWTPEITGMLMGFTLYHDRRHIARAVYEGVMSQLRISAEILRENGLSVSELMLIGGGASSELWGQMASSMLQAKVRVHRTPHEATSLGAAFAAGVGIGWYKDFSDAASNIHSVKEFNPIPEESAVYDKHFQIFRQLYPMTKNAQEAVWNYSNEKSKE